MEYWKIIILVFSGLGIFNSLAFIIYLRISGKKGSNRNLLLQLILLAFVFQIIHALLELFETGTLPYIDNLYLLGSYIQGPAMYLLIKTGLKPEFKIWPRSFLLHFLPYILFSLFPFDFERMRVIEKVAIYLVGIQLLIYILFSIKSYLEIKGLSRDNNNQFFLEVYLFPVFTLLWLNYPYSGLAGVNYQVTETILHSAFVYYLIFLKIREPRNAVDKYRFSAIDRKESEKLFRGLKELIISKELYLNADLNLNSLARKAGLQVNVLSQVINQNSGLNFSDFINSFRVEKAKSVLVEASRKGYTIASIAYDCGFNSLSAFNRAFKKTTGLTPSGFLSNTKS